MAQLLLISDMTYREGINEIGDIVGVFDDDHVFSPAEIDSFTIKQVDESVEDVYAELDNKSPDTSALTQEQIQRDVIRPKYANQVTDLEVTSIADCASCKIAVVGESAALVKVKPVLGKTPVEKSPGVSP